jgi:hypothetical protein
MRAVSKTDYQMSNQPLSWLRDFWGLVFKPTLLSDDVFEEKVEQKRSHLTKLSEACLCAQASILMEHHKKNHRFSHTSDLITLVALTRFLYQTYEFSELKPWAEAAGHTACHHLYHQKESEDAQSRSWNTEVLKATQILLQLTLTQNPKSFLVEWCPSDPPTHRVCLDVLEKADAKTIMSLYQILLYRLVDLLLGKASVQENADTPQDLWQSVADTQEMLDAVQVLWLKNPLIPVDYCDYLRSHNILEKQVFFEARQDFFFSLV